MDEDEYEKVLRSMDDVLRPYWSIQDDIERLLKSQLEFQSQISQLLEPYDHAKIHLDFLADPTVKLQEKIQRNLYPSETIRSQLRDVLNPHLEAQKQLEELLQPQKWIQDHFECILKPQVDFVESIRSQLEPVNFVRDQIGDLLGPINCYLTELKDLQISVDPAGNVSIEGDEILAGDIRAVTSTFPESQATVWDFVQQLVGWLERLAPRLRQAIVFLILPYVMAIVANLTTPIYEEWWKKYAGTDLRVARKEITRSAAELYDAEELDGCRFVYATRLHVRSDGSIKAEIIDSLTMGKIVRVIQRVKRWTEVKYIHNTTGEIATGWVFSRYLRRFEK